LEVNGPKKRREAESKKNTWFFSRKSPRRTAHPEVGSPPFGEKMKTKRKGWRKKATLVEETEQGHPLPKEGPSKG